MKKRWWLVVLSLLLTAFIFVKILRDAGQLKQLTPHFAGACKAVAGVPGAEDITFHPLLGYAYISSFDRRSAMAGHAAQGGIYRYDPRTGAAPVLLTAAFKQPFHPHGISLFVDADGEQTLFVINHATPGREQVEKLAVGADGLLQRRKILRDRKLVSINDLVAVDAQRFYVTNDHQSPRGFRQRIEDSLQLARGGVVYFDGEVFRKVVHGTAYANGINRSPDGKTLYLAQSIAKTLSIYARDPSSGSLTLRKVLPLGTAPDNLELDGAGAMYIAAHPKLLDFIAHSMDGSGETRAPAQVLKLQLSDPALPLKEVYLSAGSPLSAAATAAVLGKHMLLGPVFDPILLSCQLP